MSDMIPITVNGQPVEVPSDAMLLDAIRGLGVHIPTLCHHSALEPSGACRLCVVEVGHPDWKGWTGLVTSCLYPVEPGLEVSTISEAVRETRRTLLELYLARCPDSEQIKSIARGEGVDTTSFPARVDGDSCIQCGLCTRVCNDLSTAAIAPLGRGTEKTIGPRPDNVGEDCVGCLACAEICPTGHIQYDLGDGKLRIWNREFDLAVCEVDPDACRACGSCEAACPFSIPRVTANRNGEFFATISTHTCTGCGICAGVCPTGAISQALYPDSVLTGHALADDLRGHTVTYACSRSAFSDSGDMIPVSCVGRIGPDEILSCLSRGADGVQLLCRDRDTCPYGDGGRQGEKVVALTRDLVEYAGLGADRVTYTRPRPGIGGPDEAVADFRARTAQSPLKEIRPDGDPAITGLDRALSILGWLKDRPELNLHPPKGSSDEDVRRGLVELDLLLGDRITGWRLKDAATVGIDPDAGILGDEHRRAFRFRISPAERKQMVDDLKAADPAAACASLEELAQIKLLTRQGSWLEGLFDDPATAAGSLTGAGGQNT